jgi:hypothetical protein
MYRHFEFWQHPKQEVVSYQANLKFRKYTVRVVFCEKNRAKILEKALILKYKPRDNGLKYENYLEPEINEETWRNLMRQAANDYFDANAVSIATFTAQAEFFDRWGQDAPF